MKLLPKLAAGRDGIPFLLLHKCTPSIAKLVDHLYLENNGLLSMFLYGFRSGRSCLTSSIDFYESVLQYKLREKFKTNLHTNPLQILNFFYKNQVITLNLDLLMIKGLKN